MRTLIFTGTAGPGSALAAAATASMAASGGRKTLLVSVGPSHSINTLLKTAASPQPDHVAANLDVWAVDTPAAMSTYLDQVRLRLPGTLAQIGGDELPLIPGIEFFLCLEGIGRIPADRYDLVVVEAGPHDALLRVLSLPDSTRWGVRLLFGLDRGAGRSVASQARALVPTSLLPMEWLDPIQEARVQFERIRSAVVGSERVSVRYVLRPDQVGLDEARLAIPALHLHSLAVDALVVGPLLPVDIEDERLEEVIMQQQMVTAEAARTWERRPLLGLPLASTPETTDELTDLGQTLYRSYDPLDTFDVAPPITYSETDTPTLSLNLPGLPREQLNLTLSGDELIIRVGPYRRHILMPEKLRATGNIRASREGTRLLIRPR
ncbi:MAG: ArsA family ATPase [Chloroflexaceae bacterium]|nr:ArsA family ATPase [Chloroflexaceae bacterium]NJL33641.1 ArsA family ATPase [Chloroflexaceae bacterium]NJO04713.1 ArsA family ATPase [Chloroflexaceae bacterium]